MLVSTLKQVLIRAAKASDPKVTDQERLKYLKYHKLPPLKLVISIRKGQQVACEQKHFIPIAPVKLKGSVIVSEYEFQIIRNHKSVDSAILFIIQSASTNSLGFTATTDVNDDPDIVTNFGYLKHMRLLKKAVKVQLSIPKLIECANHVC